MPNSKYAELRRGEIRWESSRSDARVVWADNMVLCAYERATYHGLMKGCAFGRFEKGVYASHVSADQGF